MPFSISFADSPSSPDLETHTCRQAPCLHLCFPLSEPSLQTISRPPGFDRGPCANCSWWYLPHRVRSCLFFSFFVTVFSLVCLLLFFRREPEGSRNSSWTLLLCSLRSFPGPIPPYALVTLTPFSYLMTPTPVVCQAFRTVSSSARATLTSRPQHGSASRHAALSSDFVPTNHFSLSSKHPVELPSYNIAWLYFLQSTTFWM